MLTDVVGWSRQFWIKNYTEDLNFDFRFSLSPSVLLFIVAAGFHFHCLISMDMLSWEEVFVVVDNAPLVVIGYNVHWLLCLSNRIEDVAVF